MGGDPWHRKWNRQRSYSRAQVEAAAVPARCEGNAGCWYEFTPTMVGPDGETVKLYGRDGDFRGYLAQGPPQGWQHALGCPCSLCQQQPDVTSP